MKLLLIIWLFVSFGCKAQDIQHAKGILVYNYFKIGEGDHYFIPLNHINSDYDLQKMVKENNLGIGFNVKYLEPEWEQLIVSYGSPLINKALSNNNDDLRVALVEISFSYHPLSSKRKTRISKLPLHLFENEFFFKYDSAKYFDIVELKLIN